MKTKQTKKPEKPKEVNTLKGSAEIKPRETEEEKMQEAGVICASAAAEVTVHATISTYNAHVRMVLRCQAMSEALYRYYTLQTHEIFTML